MRVVNVFDAAMEEGPGRGGFWFRAAELGAGLEAARIGAAIYEARAGVPIWPYHYHYPDEEWLYVLDGAPVLRDAGGRRVLEVGDVVCFPPGHRGAHTLEGPGRFILFSGENSSGPFVSVYPDSDKVSVFPGVEDDGLNVLRLLRADSVDYWHGEGGDPVPPAAVTREPEGASGPPTVNPRHLTFEPGQGWRWARLGVVAGGQRLDGAGLELDSEADFGPYRYDYGRELWLLVLTGTPTVLHSDGERALSPGDLACLPEGPAGGAACSTAASRWPASCCCGRPASPRPSATPRPGSGCCAPLPAPTTSACEKRDSPRETAPCGRSAPAEASQPTRSLISSASTVSGFRGIDWTVADWLFPGSWARRRQPHRPPGARPSRWLGSP